MSAINQTRAELLRDSGLASVWNMLEDRKKGGAEHLVDTLLSQVDARASGGRRRSEILVEITQRETVRLERLLQGEFMIPPAEPRDLRRESLERFQASLMSATMPEQDGKPAYLPEIQMRRLNLALRDLLNIDYRDLEILPTANAGITPDFIRQQYHGWIRKQTARWRDGAKVPSDPRGARPEWTLIGLTSPALVESSLTGIIESIPAEEIAEIARWLKEDVRAAHQDGVHISRRDNHLPFLAVRMANALVGPPARAEMDDETKPPSYSVFMEQFLSVRLPELINARTGKLEKVDVPGTQELRDLCRAFEIILADKDSQELSPG